MTIAEALAEFHEANPVAFLATRDGELPRVRPMSPVEIDGATVWMASGASSEKMAQIVGEPRAELCYMKPDHAHLRLRGAVEVCDDPDTKRRLWNAYPMLAEYFKSAEDPEYVLLKMTVEAGFRMPSMSYAYETLEP